MGWNTLSVKDTWLDPALENLHAYFVHSFYVPLGRYTSAETNYVIPFSSGLRKNNFYAVQFHPEKSAKAGELVLQSFLKI
jgi:glutamine amidotransferase